MRGYTTFDPNGSNNRQMPTVRLVEEKARESDRMLQLQQQQEELEREQELADQLFNDTGAEKRGGRKRGQKSLDAFMSQGTTKKRGRARR